MADAPAPHDAAGHRGRLRDRLLADPAGLQDYELLEYLLGLAIRQGDTKPTAKALIREFGSIGRVLAAPPDALMRIKGVKETSAAAIRIAHATALALLRNQIAERPLLASWQAMLDYLRADMAWLDIERIRILYLDGKNRLIRDEVMSEGSVDTAALHIREVVKRAIELSATALILVHNHPSGDPQPSRADIQLTRDIADAGRKLGIAIHDHVIVGANGHVSLRAQGLM